MNTSERLHAIESLLIQTLHPETLTIQDDSQDHIGHAGARAGGHFTIMITSTAFEEKSLVERHRLVYDALGELMKTEIHALRIEAKTPNEASSNASTQ